MSFSSLALDDCLIQAINELSYQAPTPIQESTIPVILAGKDVMAGAQTGTGKTAAFALPILHLLMQQVTQKEVRALVLVPTRELAQQVYKSFNQYGKYSGLNMALAYGGVSINPQIEQIRTGIDILVATPGRLFDHLIKGTLTLDKLQVLVFDEAERMLDMGFKDEIGNIMKRVPDKRQTLLFSATFDDVIFKLSKKLLKDPELIEVDQRNTAAERVEQIVYTVDGDRKRELVSHLIGARNWHHVLIFVRTRQGADLLVREMSKDGIKAQAIHGDRSQGAREKALTEFKAGKVRALVATDVAARGLDIVDLQYVINYDLPYIAEDYIHRIGRTGRAGKAGLAVTLMSPGEEYLLEEVEAVLDTRLLQQWLPGYEPDLTKSFADSRKNSRTAQKRRAKKRAMSKKTGNRRR